MPGIVELTYRDLRLGNDSRDFHHLGSKVAELRKRGTYFEDLRGLTIIFRTFSSEYDKNGIIYTNEIKLLDLPEMLGERGVPLKDRVLQAMQGDVAVNCNCPAFLFWGFAYILTQMDGMAEHPESRVLFPRGRKVKPPPPTVGAENRFPKVRNKTLTNVMCKHLDLVMGVLGAHWNTIVSKLRQQGWE